jgi:Xaa-Pro dipeptidase
MTHPRVQTIQQMIARSDLGAIALIPGANLQYVTGCDFHLMERPLIAFFRADAAPLVLLPALEVFHMERSNIDCELFPWDDTEGYQAALAAIADQLKLGGRRLGVEELRMRVMESQLIQQFMPGVEIVPAGLLLASLRLKKDERALDCLRRAVAISEGALQACLAQVHPGMTEREVASLLVIEQFKRGGGKQPFESIVLSGPNSALPHGEPGVRRLTEGEPLLFDFGTTVQGYVSDITRTFSLGEPSPRLKEIYAIVKAANAAGRAAAGPGVPAQEVDRAARQVIADAGYGPYFTHRTGHGLGLEPHEGPNMVEGNTLLLEPGMVFTVEPGIYLPDELGVRIEDDMAITPNGAESLTTFSRDLTRIG